MNERAFEPGPLAEVDSELGGDRPVLVFVRELRHPPQTVWAALTDPEQLRLWAPFVADRDLGRAGAATLTMIDGQTEHDLVSSIVRAEPPTVLEYSWGPDLLRWDLAATDQGTRLTLRHTVTEKVQLPPVAAGWHLCLRVAELLLDGRPIEPIRGQDALHYGFDALNEAYARELDARQPQAED